MTLSVGFVGQPHVSCGASQAPLQKTAIMYVSSTCIIPRDSMLTTYRYTLACRIPVIIAQTIVVVLTWKKTYEQYASGMRFVSRISVSLFRNGACLLPVLCFFGIDVVSGNAYFAYVEMGCVGSAC